VQMELFQGNGFAKKHCSSNFLLFAISDRTKLYNNCARIAGRMHHIHAGCKVFTDMNAWLVYIETIRCIDLNHDHIRVYLVGVKTEHARVLVGPEFNSRACVLAERATEPPMCM
jgi:hypothetical protein